MRRKRENALLVKRTEGRNYPSVRGKRVGEISVMNKYKFFMSTDLQVIRTIHPVGQGAFYSETLHRPGFNDDKHIVYDCGSLSSKSRLKEDIDNFLPKGSTIDVLFISHFHDDHVNGIKHLAKKYNIKNVVLPQIDQYEWFYIVENFMATGTPNASVVSDVRVSVGDARVIEVAPMGDSQDTMLSDEPLILHDFGINNNSRNLVIARPSPIVISSRFFSLWHFIVVNPLKGSNIAALKAELENIDYEGRKLTIEDLHKHKVLTALRGEIQEAYRRIFKGGNEYSMCMLSELADRKHYCSFSSFSMPSCRCLDFRDWILCRKASRYRNSDGGLYCGDADFRHCDTLDCLKGSLRGREENVALLQLPHHGSKENFNIDLLNWLENLHVSFACYGTPNRYNHPSSDVISTAGTYCCVVGVDQNKSNVLTERIDVYMD